jgi:hypothetical protein
MMMLNIGTRVNVKIQSDALPGTVCGHGFCQSEHSGAMEPTYLVRIDNGFWTENHLAFINVIVVHYDNVEEVNS